VTGPPAGKSVGLLLAALDCAANQGSALIVVPSLVSSRLPELARQWLGKPSSPRSWELPGGGRLLIDHRHGHLPLSDLVAVDDAVRLQPDDLARLVGLAPKRIFAASPEPGAPGLGWLRERFFPGGEVVLLSPQEVPGGERVSRIVERLPEPRRSTALGDWDALEPREEIPLHPQPVSIPGGDTSFGGELSGGGVIEGVAVLVGFDERGQEVVWEPGRLANPHLCASGESGAGKTQALQGLAAGLLDQRVAVLALDPKDDWSGAFAEREGLEVFDPSQGALPFNPLVPPLESGQIDPLAHIHRVVDVIKRVWGVGDQQAARLREALKELLQGCGIPLGPHAPVDRPWPAFSQVAELLKPTDTVRSRLSQVFDLGLLDPGDESGFGRLVSAGGVLRLARLPGDEPKAAAAELFLLALYHELVRLPHVPAGQLRLALVLDEAWRLRSCPFLGPLLREGRAFGLSVMLASQFPRDLPAEVRGNCALQLYFGQTQAEQAQEAARAVYGETHSTRAILLGHQVSQLPVFSCLLYWRRDGRSETKKLQTTPWFQRRGSGPQPPPKRDLFGTSLLSSFLNKERKG
jgi:hypothetical protein